MFGCFPCRIMVADSSMKAWNSAVCHQRVAICLNPGRNGVVVKYWISPIDVLASGFEFRPGNGHSG